MEVVHPMHPAMGSSHFDSSACSSPFTTAPSSPARRSGVGHFYFSAPTSPSRVHSAVVPYLWDDFPGKPKTSVSVVHDEDDDFEFQFSGPLTKELPISTADQLFHEGKIRPLLQLSESSIPPSPRSPRRTSMDQGKRIQRGDNSGRFSAANDESRKPAGRKERGRRTRSLSPLRNEFFGDSCVGEDQEGLKPSPSKGSKRWSIRDLLFRSASEGRAKKSSDSKNSSFRSTEVASRGGSGRRSSAHELHYAANRALSEELKKRTFLPYRRGVLGCLGFGTGSFGIGGLFTPFSRQG
ncbi:uncharacterized protein LOC116259000 [Nymphaea colorata]|nr:uncharacterized protein LOC116259000 [Nymphaea colorata]